jgi:hypothetical protein
MCAALGAGLGYTLRTNDGFHVNNGVIEYKGIRAPIRVQDDCIVVGTLEERIGNIIVESPDEVRRATAYVLQKHGLSLP